ncbi:g12550 [Coccomyxa viridis]|uniref:G12550 protein n=1 Tax=Coccomyxa viridis TaxID=1274662 RepID=A0ABP1GD96_9CHLO
MSGNAPVPGTAGVSGGGAAASDVHGLKTGAQYPSDTTTAGNTTGSTGTNAVPATAGYSGGGATVSDEHGVATGKQYPGTNPGATTGSVGTSTVPATAGYSGGGATVSDEHGVATGKQYPGNNPGATTGGAQGQQSSVIGAGADKPVSTVPVAGANTGNTEKPSAQDKARSKTAVLAAGVQEDLAKMREKLTVKDGVQAPPPGSAGAAGGDYHPPAEAGQKTSFTDKAKAFAVKAIDHTSSALESAKQNVTKQTTMPAQGGNAATTGTSGAATGAHGGPTTQ